MQIGDIVFELRKKEEDNKDVLSCVIYCHSNTLTKKYGTSIRTCGISPRNPEELTQLWPVVL